MSVRLKAKLFFDLKLKLLRDSTRLVVGLSSASSQSIQLLVVFDKAKVRCWEKSPLRRLLNIFIFKLGRVRFFKRVRVWSVE